MAVDRRKFLALSAGVLTSLEATSRISVSQVSTGPNNAIGASVAPIGTFPSVSSTFGGVPIGCGSDSFPSNSIEEIPGLLKRIGFGMVEITSVHLEPKTATPANSGSAAGSSVRPQGTPSGNSTAVPQAGPSRSADPEGWARLRDWRLNTPMSYFESVGRSFSDAGIVVYAYNTHWNDDVTDEELDRTFKATRAMGASVITAVCPPTNEFARRLDPIAKTNYMRVGIHNTRPSPLNSEAAWDTLLRECSRFVGINLDIGHYIDGGGDPVALVRSRRDLIVDIHIKPKGNPSPSSKIPVDGDSTVRDFLAAMRDNRWSIPCNFEDERRQPDKLTTMALWYGYLQGVLGV